VGLGEGRVTETHGSEPAIKVSASWDCTVLTVGRDAVRGITSLLILVLIIVWSHSILHEKML
jgi:hypothetical protein